MRLIAGTRPDRPLTLAEHLAVHGALPRTGRGLVDEVETSGLTGRGGAGYPLAGKMRTVQSQSRLRGRPVVVVNAAESEPAAVKDASLVTRAPHLVLDGAAACARAVGAREVVVWVHRGGQGAEQAVETAAFERLSVGLDTVRVEVVAGPDRYVSGEASAIVRHLSGGPAMPSATAYRTAERGVRGRPTLLANAETFAHAGLVARHGAAWFRSVGPPDEPGTMLATVRGGVVRPGVVEVPLGAPLVEALEACGGLRTPVSALLVGGVRRQLALLGRRPHRDTGPGLVGGPRCRPRHRAPAGAAGRPVRARGGRAAGRLAGRGVGRAVRPVPERAARHGGRPHGHGDR